MLFTRYPRHACYPHPICYLRLQFHKQKRDVVDVFSSYDEKGEYSIDCSCAHMSWFSGENQRERNKSHTVELRLDLSTCWELHFPSIKAFRLSVLLGVSGGHMVLHQNIRNTCGSILCTSRFKIEQMQDWFCDFSLTSPPPSHSNKRNESDEFMHNSLFKPRKIPADITNKIAWHLNSP